QVNLSPEAVNLLAAMIGSDLWQLDREIHKLANYKKGEKVTTEDINLMVKGKYNDDIFQLMDAISDRDKKRILELFQDQLESGASELYLLTMLIRQFRIFWQIKELVDTQSMSSDLVARELKMHPYVAKKSMYYIKNFELDQLRKIYQRLLDFEIKIKTKSIKFEVLFDLLVAEL
ncbi:DNA polymerase III subunit delta, partial [Candidatus Kuenenbacteria bacterium]|nr:DNA polymerase III subunit delta [Candidatus Kuenenbacteria bacterium]